MRGGKKDTIVMETERLYVRTWRSSDIDPLYRIQRDPRMHTYTTEEPWTIGETWAFVEKAIRDCSGCQPGYFNCPLILKTTDELIGRVGLNRLGQLPVPEMEIMIAPDHWGQGYATEIAREMLKYGFEKAGFEEILGFVMPENTASRRVLETIGMTYVRDREWRGTVWSFYRATKGPHPTITADW